LLVSIDPPLPAGPSKEISTVALATRHDGASLTPISEWPIHVYVIQLHNKDVNSIDAVVEGAYSVLYWGMLYQTLDQALADRLPSE
jgi:hypothetical protein